MGYFQVIIITGSCIDQKIIIQNFTFHVLLNSSQPVHYGRRQNLPLQSSENIQIPRSIGSSHYSSNASSTFFGNRETQQQDNDEIMEQDFDFSEFKFKGFLGHGQTGGTYRCEFYGQTIALKALGWPIFSYNAKKKSKYTDVFLKFKECISQDWYVMVIMGAGWGTTIVGTVLNFHKIEQIRLSRH